MFNEIVQLYFGIFSNVIEYSKCMPFILQGQMLYIAETDLILFQCYPSVMNLDDLTK